MEKFINRNDYYHIHNPLRLHDLGPEMPELKVMVIGTRSSGKSNVVSMLRHHIPSIKRVDSASLLMHPLLVSLTQRILKSVTYLICFHSIITLINAIMI
jgi:GTPase SAR1 family protein